MDAFLKYFFMFIYYFSHFRPSRVLQGFIWPMLVGSAVMGPRTPEHLTELEAFFKEAPKPIGAGER